MAARDREFISSRAAGRCEYCHWPDEADDWPFHVEHIIARQHGGDDTTENCCWACSRCNLYKGTNLASIDPQSGHHAQLFNPRAQSWNEHFMVQDATIVGLSETGRATARLLRMNDVRRVEIRRELIEEGLFEP